MSVASDKHVLKKRIDRYIWESSGERSITLRSLLRDRFMDTGRVAIVGGMVRDFARRGREGFSSDVDLVIDADPNDVAALAGQLNAKPNRFGGFSWVSGSWKIDFWALHTTWSYREGHAKVSVLEDIIRCTFFDWDAVMYDLSARRVYCDDTYIERLKSGCLDINLMATPSIQGNLLRAVRRLLLWDLEQGPRLAEFIDKHLDQESFAQIAATNRSLYGDTLVSGLGGEQRLRSVLSSKEKRNSLATFYGRQLNLPGLEASDYQGSQSDYFTPIIA